MNGVTQLYLMYIKQLLREQVKHVLFITKYMTFIVFKYRVETWSASLIWVTH